MATHRCRLPSPRELRFVAQVEPRMSIRTCNCSNAVHVASTGAGAEHFSIPPAHPLPPYAAPTHALILHLSNFPPARAEVAPHLTALRARATDMRLKWQEDAEAGYAREQGEGSAPLPPSDRAVSSLLRIVGLDPSEQAASLIRAESLKAARASSGVTASPAAAYPPALGRARVEIATNHLGAHDMTSRRIETLKRTGGPVNVVQSVFLDPQVAIPPTTTNSSAPSSSAFLASPRPPLQSHSSVPLKTEDQRKRYISSIVCHVAERLGYSSAGAVGSSSSSTAMNNSSSASILLLHLDAHALLGCPLSNEDVAQFSSASLQFVDQVLAALCAQLTDSTAPPASAVFNGSDSASTAAASSGFLESVAQRCPHLFWCVVDDRQIPEDFPSSSTMLPFGPSQLLASLRPKQSYQVQNGIADPRTDGWSTCSAFIWHMDSTRVTGAPSNSPIHGDIHIAHFLKELVFKLGLGSKYGA